MVYYKKKLYKFAGLSVVVALINLCWADEGDKNIQFYGSAWIQSGQLANYKYWVAGNEFKNQWIQDNIVILGMKTQFHPRLQGTVGLMGWMFYSTWPDSMVNDPSRDIKDVGKDFILQTAEATLNLSPDPQDSLLKVHVGLFPYKYNRDVRNLGEYVFRTGCYPGFIRQDGFDMANAHISGIRVTSDYNSWHNELLLTTELYTYPMNDFSLTYISDYTPLQNKMLNVGAAVQLYRCLPVSNDYTQPKIYQNYKNAAPNFYFNEGDAAKTDTLWYTFAGTKIMARLSFDPKPLFNMDIFGPEDLKFYSEAIILGVKNYPANYDVVVADDSINPFGYNKLLEKMPIMVGFNLPVFKFLDVFSVEAEYYGKKYVNRVPVVTQGILMPRLPLPYDPNVNSGEPEGSNTGGAGGTGEYSKSTYYSGAAQWKWSVYAKRTIFNNFSIVAQAARDHKRIQTSIARSIDAEEALIKDKQWYWMLKFAYNF